MNNYIIYKTSNGIEIPIMVVDTKEKAINIVMALREKYQNQMYWYN